MGQSAHPGRARGGWSAVWAAAGVLAGALTLSGCSTSVAAATTTLEGVAQVTVVHPDGSQVGGWSGLRLRRGDVVRTGPAGRAELVTRSRVVYVASQASVQVVDGARQQLRQGAVVVDAQHGPGLDLHLAGLDVTTSPGAAVRAERAVTVRVGALAGSARVVSDTGRALVVPALWQAVIGGDALPDAATPLRLTDDSGEAHAVPALVRDDETLTTLAAGIDNTGRSTARLVTAAWHRTPTDVPRGVARSEQVVPIVLAAAGGRTAEMARYDHAVGWRQAGGSWGVVAHLLGVRVASALDALAAFERTQPAGTVGTVPAVLAAIGDVGAAGVGTPSDGGGSSPTRSGSGGSGGSGRSPAPSPSPSSASPVTTTLDTVTSTVRKVLSVVPTPTPSPTSPAPNAAPTSGPLLPLGAVTYGLPLPSLP